MQIKIIDLQNKEVGKKTLPPLFGEELRPDLIRRAYYSVKSNERQRYGTSPTAGIRQSVEVSKRRRDFRGSYGIGISRIPRKVVLRRGTRFNWIGAFIPSAVGGRSAFPPKAEKNWEQKINIKERRKSIRSAIAATINTDLVKSRHKTPATYPFILSSDLEGLEKTKDVVKVLETIGLKDELLRIKKKKVRAGKGKMRGRKYQPKKGPLIVVSGECKLEKAAKNIGGVDVIEVRHLNVTNLAPGGFPGRLTLWSDAAISVIEKEKLFR